jgi:hypothetical protein
MSLNQLVSYNPAIDDTERLDLKVGNIDCLSINCDDIDIDSTYLFNRIYNTPQFKSIVNPTTATSLYQTNQQVGSNVIPANTIVQGTTLIFEGWGLFNTTNTGLQMQFDVRYNGTRVNQNVVFQLSQAYPTNSTYKYKYEMLHTTSGDLKGLATYTFSDIVTGFREEKLYNDYNLFGYDGTIANTVDFQVRTLTADASFITVSNSVTKIH